MGIEDKPMPRSLMTPGREDLSPWPPVGQLEFEKITAMEESGLDRAFLERHGLGQVIEENHYHGEKKSGRRVELKRLILARLEGYSPSGPEIGEWYMEQNAAGGDPINVLSQIINHVSTPETRFRIQEVQKRFAREALRLVPSEKLKSIEFKIQNILRQHGLRPLTIQEILPADKIPRARFVSGESFLDIENVLQFYLSMLEGGSTINSARRMGSRGKEKSGDVLVHRFFTKEAKDALRTVRGLK